MIKWQKKNWLIVLAILIIIGLFWNRGCSTRSLKEDLKESNEKVSTLEKRNVKLEDEAFDSAQEAVKWEERAKEKEDIIKARNVEIVQLKEDLKKVQSIIMALPPSKLVEEMQEILDCAEIELFYFHPESPKVLFSEKCARSALTELAKFSLVKREVGLIEQSMIDCEEGWTFQKIAHWNTYRTAWSLGSQVLNYKNIIKEKDHQFSLLKKEKKKTWLNGLFQGFLIGVGTVIIISLTRSLL